MCVRARALTAVAVRAEMKREARSRDVQTPGAHMRRRPNTERTVAKPACDRANTQHRARRRGAPLEDESSRPAVEASLVVLLPAVAVQCPLLLLRSDQLALHCEQEGIEPRGEREAPAGS